MKEVSIDKLGEISSTLGLKIVGITDLSPLKQAGKALKIWQDEGKAGQMSYMNRDVELLQDPSRLMPEAKSIICLALSYSSDPHPALRLGYGRVARYAWGLDYHHVIPAKLKQLVALIEKQIGRSLNFRIFSDALPLLERALAQRAGLGFIGKNTMLIRKTVGSFFFLAELLSDLALDINGNVNALAMSSCGSCQRCKDQCPTGALQQDYVLDARKCISYLSIEKRGLLNTAEQIALGEWVFGCDICQDICPFNHRTLKQKTTPDLSEFAAAQGVGPLVDLGSLLRIKTNSDFKERFGRTALMRAGRDGLVRNALVVAANTGASDLYADIFRLAETDRSELVREQARSVLQRLHLI